MVVLDFKQPITLLTRSGKSFLDSSDSFNYISEIFWIVRIISKLSGPYSTNSC